MALTSSPLSIGRPTRTCAATGRALHIGEVYVAALVESAGPGDAPPQRLDFSLEGWKAQRPHGRHLIAFWRSHVTDPGQKVKPILDDEALLDLFDSTAGDGVALDAAAGSAGPAGDAEGATARGDSSSVAAAREALRFVLAILLVRRRLLSHEGMGPGGVIKVRRRGDPRPPEGPPLVELRDPGLDESTLAEVLSQLEELGAVAAPEAPVTTKPTRAGAAT